MIPYLRIYDSSIINYLKYEVLPLHFTERVENEPLTFDSSLQAYVTDSSMIPKPTSPGRGWALFDESIVNGRTVVDASSEQTTKVSVVGASSYTIDYQNGYIIGPDSEPESVSYSWYYVSLIEGWPGEAPPPLPIVAVDISRTLKSGYQLGGGSKDVLEGVVHIFATSEAEKKDITDVIYQAFFNRTLLIGNWHEGGYIDFNGTYTGFVPTTVSGISSGCFVDVVAELSIPRLDWSEINRHRSRVRFTFEVYKND